MRGKERLKLDAALFGGFGAGLLDRGVVGVVRGASASQDAIASSTNAWTGRPW